MRLPRRVRTPRNRLVAGHEQPHDDDMYVVLALMKHLLDTLIPPAGGPQRDVDARFAELVERYHHT